MLRVSRVDIEVHCHATEDPDRVMRAIRGLVPEGVRYSVEETVYHGYYGNPIRIMRITVSGRDAERVVRHIASMLRGVEKSILRASFSLRYEARGKRLHIRLDKQRLYHGEASVSETGDIVKVTVHLSGRGDAEEFFREIGLI